MLKHGRAAPVALAAAACLALAPAGASAQTALKFGHIVDTTHPIHLGATAMNDHVSRCTGGKVKIDIFPNAQLGNESALNDQIRLGGVDFANSGASFLSRNHPHLGISSLPYIFRDRNHAIAFVKSPVLRELMDGWEKSAGQILLSGYYSAAFHVFAQDPYPKPEDMKGKKIRVPDAPAWLVFYKAIGANPVPIALGDTYLALRQGVVDGTNMPLAVGFSTKLNEVTKVITMTYHQMEMAMLLTGAHVKSRLPADQWQCVVEGGKIYGEVAQREIIRGEDELRVDATKKNLIKFVDPDLGAYRQATAAIIAEKVKAGEFPQALVDRIQAVK
jgi:tripartite ATP-independent transporter DctP family solute receptor